MGPPPTYGSKTGIRLDPTARPPRYGAQANEVSVTVKPGGVRRKIPLPSRRGLRPRDGGLNEERERIELQRTQRSTLPADSSTRNGLGRLDVDFGPDPGNIAPRRNLRTTLRTSRAIPRRNSRWLARYSDRGQRLTNREQPFPQDRNRGFCRLSTLKYRWILILLSLLIGGVAVVVFLFKRSHKGKQQLTYSDARAETSLTAITHTLSGSLQDQMYFVFHQHDNGDIRVSTYMYGEWSVYKVTTDARNGTGLSAMVTSYSYTSSPAGQSVDLSLFYIDKTNILQELRTSTNATVTGWTKGSLGNAGFKASLDHPYLDSGYADLSEPDGDDEEICPGLNKASWLMFRPAEDDAIQELFWDSVADSWHRGARFEGLNIGSDFVTMETPLPPENRPLPITRWLYGIGNDSQLQEWHCENCCVNTTDSWKKGNTIPFPPQFDNSTLSLAGRSKQSSRLLYSRLADGTVISMEDRHNVSQTLNSSAQIALYPMGLETVGPAMLGTKLAVARGPAGEWGDMLVYQTNGTDVTATYPGASDHGSAAIPLGWR